MRNDEKRFFYAIWDKKRNLKFFGLTKRQVQLFLAAMGESLGSEIFVQYPGLTNWLDIRTQKIFKMAVSEVQ